jgi:hypothetical protein
VKLLVNDEVEMLGAAGLEVVLVVDDVVLGDELPQAATATLAVTAQAAITALLLSKSTVISSPIQLLRQGYAAVDGCLRRTLDPGL